jgi:ribose 5-phosphate isomerase B
MAERSVVIACDHGAVTMKEALLAHCQERGLQVVDLGTHGTESVDYPDMAAGLANALAEGRGDVGILLCGSGIGISIAANRFPFIRAALVHDAYGARMARQHNDANVICLGGRTTGLDIAREALDIFLDTGFEGGRHQRRVDKLLALPATPATLS